MADSEGGGGSGWLGFLAGIIVVALIGFAIYAYTGQPPQRTAQLEVNAPNVKINPPDINLPSPPPNPAPPQAQAPQQAPTAPPPAQTNP